ncbi:hypothetical protein Q0590_16895 [Rhodocytophaga aerolata]|uniref:GLPGLI family protein n=1 Tax=Rhodocytophaga aerolata TaxID=455078 RepID=A0ABT8R787_9BACT|nr:hypothetical protein [Rhodocytophaga aerolata]MDO1447952.1 hypothetical protein [Rhodocytophaga aerolata]
MKILLVNLLLLLTTNLWSQTELGLGLVSINLNDKTVLHFYKNITDKAPSKTIEFFNDKTINSWNIKELDKQKNWLKPEVLWLDYSSFIFRCVVNKEGWFQVITNQENGERYWLKNSKMTTFNTWENYLKGMFGVKRLPTNHQKIRSSPTDNSAEIKYQGEDCFGVKSMKGDWIEIYTADYCDESYTDNKTPLKRGWIRWKRGNELLIEYFTTS